MSVEEFQTTLLESVAEMWRERPELGHVDIVGAMAAALSSVLVTRHASNGRWPEDLTAKRHTELLSRLLGEISLFDEELPVSPVTEILERASRRITAATLVSAGELQGSMSCSRVEAVDLMAELLRLVSSGMKQAASNHMERESE